MGKQRKPLENITGNQYLSQRLENKYDKPGYTRPSRPAQVKISRDQDYIAHEMAASLAKKKQKVVDKLEKVGGKLLKRLLPHEQLFVLLYAVTGLPITIAYKISHLSQYGFSAMSTSDKAIVEQATALANKEDVNSAILTIYEEAGLSLRNLALTVADALGATKTERDPDTGELSNSNVPDHVVRLRAVKLAHEVRGELGQKKVQKNTLNVNVDVDTKDHSVEEVESAVEEVLKEKFRKKKRTKIIDQEPLSADSSSE